MSDVSAETVTRKIVLIRGVGVGTKHNREQAQVAFFGVIIKIHYLQKISDGFNFGQQ